MLKHFWGPPLQKVYAFLDLDWTLERQGWRHYAERSGEMWCPCPKKDQ